MSTLCTVVRVGAERIRESGRFVSQEEESGGEVGPDCRTSRPVLSELLLPRLCHLKVPQSSRISPLAKDQVFRLVNQCKIFQSKPEDIVRIRSGES